MTKTFEEVEKIIDLYKDGNSLCYIAKLIGTAHKTVAQYLDKNDIARPRKTKILIRDDIKTKDIINLYINGKNTKEISKILDCSIHLILKRIKKVGFKLREYRNTLNHTFFSNFTDESCYWAGFIAADGWIGKNNGLGIEIKDKEHIEKFYKIINAKTKIYNRLRAKSNTYCIRITSKQIIKDLQQNFNIIQNKSLVLLPPNILENNYLSHFIRGYIDGDGCLLKTRPIISVLGTQEMLIWIKELLNKNCNLKLRSNIYKKKNIYQLSIGGSIQCPKIISWLYKDSTPDTRLDRKYEIARKYSQDI